MLHDRVEQCTTRVGLTGCLDTTVSGCRKTLCKRPRPYSKLSGARRRSTRQSTCPPAGLDGLLSSQAERTPGHADHDLEYDEKIVIPDNRWKRLQDRLHPPRRKQSRGPYQKSGGDRELLGVLLILSMHFVGGILQSVTLGDKP
ncbi:hypothetical protein DENSPDRAFT_855557 [Dentipellis sp. KUC8613]|nr:hypothetical protein DENSPDRAFT_855557 [Dentipellis sp. KUC8613]